MRKGKKGKRVNGWMGEKYRSRCGKVSFSSSSRTADILAMKNCRKSHQATPERCEKGEKDLIFGVEKEI
jgi:hypothetical protein